MLVNKKKKGAVNKIPPPITKINEASQLCVILRNPITFSGFVIPEIIKPTPKIIPLSKENILSIINKHQIAEVYKLLLLH